MTESNGRKDTASEKYKGELEAQLRAARTSDYADLPDWTFEGWRECATKGWAEIRPDLLAAGDYAARPWDDRDDRLFFRGGDTHWLRSQLDEASTSGDYWDLLDVRAGDWQTNRAQFVTLEDAVYLLYVLHGFGIALAWFTWANGAA